MKRVLSIGSILLTMLVGCASQAEFGDAINEGEPTPIPTSAIPTRPIYDVQRGDIIDQREYFGRISVVESAELLFEIDGRVEEIVVSNGDAVMVGDHLASLDTTNLEAQLLDAEEELAVAQSLLTSAENQLSFARREVDLQVQLAQNFLEFAKSEAATDPSTQADLLVSQREIELSLVQLQSEKLVEGVDPSLIFDVARAQDHVDHVKGMIEQAVLTAPMGGIITSQLVETGDFVDAYVTIGIVSDLTEVEVTDTIEDDEASDLTEGLPALMQRANAPDEAYAGQITILPQPFGSGSDNLVHVQFNTQPREGEFTLGERMSFVVTIAERKNVLWLPVSAIRQFSGRDFVVIQDEGVERRVDVELGLKGDNRVEILEGLEEGQRVVAP